VGITGDVTDETSPATSTGFLPLTVMLLVVAPVDCEFHRQGISTSAPDRDDAMPHSHLHTGIALVE